MFEDIANRLKAARKKTGYTQKQMGEAIGSSLSAWQDYEAGKSIPGGNALAGLSRLGVDINWLLTGEGGKESVKVFLETINAEDYLLSILPQLSQIVELHYSDDRREQGVSHLVRFKSGELQLVYSTMCHDDRGSRISEVERVRHGIAVYSHQLLYAVVSAEQLLSIEENPSPKAMEDILFQAKPLMPFHEEIVRYKKWLNFNEVSSAQYEAPEERCSSGPIEEFLLEKRISGQDTGWVSLAFADCFSEFREWLERRRKNAK